MKKFVEFILNNPIKIVIVIIAIFIFSAYWAKNITIDPDIMRALSKRIPERENILIKSQTFSQEKKPSSFPFKYKRTLLNRISKFDILFN